MKAILFDYDGVLTTDRTGSLTTNGFISRHTGIPYEAVSAAFKPYNDALNRGLTSYRAIWPAICKTLATNIPEDVLVAAFESTPVNHQMLELARTLKTHFAVGIITDNKGDRLDHLIRHQRLDDVFFPIVVSSKVGAVKESPAIYEHALSQLNLPAEECLFIDNTAKNLMVAAALGMATILFDDESNDVAGLAEVLRDRHGVMALQRPSPSFKGTPGAAA